MARASAAIVDIASLPGVDEDVAVDKHGTAVQCLLLDCPHALAAGVTDMTTQEDRHATTRT